MRVVTVGCLGENKISLFFPFLLLSLCKIVLKKLNEEAANIHQMQADSSSNNHQNVAIYNRCNFGPPYAEIESL